MHAQSAKTSRERRQNVITDNELYLIESSDTVLLFKISDVSCEGLYTYTEYIIPNKGPAIGYETNSFSGRGNVRRIDEGLDNSTVNFLFLRQAFDFDSFTSKDYTTDSLLSYNNTVIVYLISKTNNNYKFRQSSVIISDFYLYVPKDTF
jgi:hypothetical protein